MAPIEDRVGLHCPFCGSKHVGTVCVEDESQTLYMQPRTHNPCSSHVSHNQLRRNAITDVEEAMLESSCESCGRTWVAQEQAVGEGW